MGLAFVGGLILIVLAIGLIQTYVIEPNNPIAIVDGTEISTAAYRSRVEYERFILDRQLEQILTQQANLAGGDNEQLSQFLAQQYQQLTNQILQQRSTIDRQVVDMMIDDILINQEATRRGLSVSDSDINEFINRFLAGQQGALTGAAASETVTARAEATETAAVWTPTPTFTPSPTLTTTEVVTPTATPVDTPTPAPTPTLHVLDDTALSSEYSNWLTTLREGPGLDETAYRGIIRTVVLARKVREAMGTEVPTSAEQANARHILLETEAEAKSVVERLKAGEDFAALATELSTDTGSAANGGELGFVSRGTFVASVDEAVFSLPLGQISEPVQSQFGWHVLEVLARETRELSPSEYQRSQRQAFDQWLIDTRAAARVEDFWTPDKAPRDPNNPLLQGQAPEAAFPAPGG
jgi:parvulin-like peptidyl-prolyl isomerase